MPRGTTLSRWTGRVSTNTSSASGAVRSLRRVSRAALGAALIGAALVGCAGPAKVASPSQMSSVQPSRSTKIPASIVPDDEAENLDLRTDSDGESPEPATPLAAETTQSAIDLASTFAAAYTRTDLAPAEWVDGFRSLLFPRLQTQYELVDVNRVNLPAFTGAEVAPGASINQITVLTHLGETVTLSVTVSRHKDTDPFLISNVGFPAELGG